MNLDLRYPEYKSKVSKHAYANLRSQYLDKEYIDSPLNAETQISLFHIGGRGGLGPSDRFWPLGRHCKYTFFEADLSPDPETHHFDKRMDDLKAKGCGVELKEACIAGSCSERDFYINHVPTSNSLLPINPKAGKYHMEGQGYWGRHARTVKTTSFNTVSLNHLREQNELSEGHFIVLDIQGAEGEVLEGASLYLQSDFLGLVLECEMFPIYKDQPLFNDTFSLLTNMGFLFFGFWKDKMQSWHPYLPLGKGRSLVGEAIYLKDFEYLIQVVLDPKDLTIQLMRLARLAFSLHYDSYGYEVLNYATQKHPDIIDELVEVPYIGDMIELWKIVNNKYQCWPKLEHIEDLP